MKNSLGFFISLLKYEALVYVRKINQAINPLIFFFLIISLFPMGISVENALLQKVAPGIVWLSFLLASLLCIERIFLTEFESGVLEQHLLSPVSLSMRIYSKLIMHWLLTALPLIIVTPLLGVMYDMSAAGIYALMLSLLSGTPIVTLLLGVLASMMLGVGNRGALMSLIFLPLTIPVLIFGSGSVLIAEQGIDPTPLRIMLLAFSVICWTLGPYLIRKCLFLSAE